jgi:fumarylacetoacetate (FAA) hydrolase family protein
VYDLLPDDSMDAVLIGRLRTVSGPIPVAITQRRVFDLSGHFATVAELIETVSPGKVLPVGIDLGEIDSLDLSAEWEAADSALLLAPIDLHCIKASGVTFAVSALERVIEERARGNAADAIGFRDMLQRQLGGDFASVQPGSGEAARLKALLIESGVWSQYLEVAIGPDAEIFTKAPVLSAVGSGAWVGIRSDSRWNNPEPEIVIIVDSAGRPRGATLGNDVNLRDIEGRSALLLGKAKDNTASCALGPFVRLFDDGFTMADVREAELSLTIEGDDGYRLDGTSNMRLISRDPLELISQTIGDNHQYPDGFALFLGTMFAPVDDRGEPGSGFTHKIGDVVRVATPRLGTLTNKVCLCENAPRWTYGIAALMRDLSTRERMKA